jgi:hypothetical protein
VPRHSAKKSDSLDEMETAFLFCREKNHSWQHVNDKILVRYKGVPRQIERQYKCSRCTTEMFEELHIPSFDIQRRTYVYVDGYLLSKAGLHELTGGAGRVNVRFIREEGLIRSGVLKTRVRTKPGAKKGLRVVS